MTPILQLPVGALAQPSSSQPSPSQPPPTDAETARPDITVLVTVTLRPSSLVDLYHEFAAALRAANHSFEFIFLAHPEHERLTVPLRPLVTAGEPIRVVVVGRSIGETALLRMGLVRSRGRIVLTLPAYRQTTAEGVAELIAQVEQGADVAAARRWPRRDPFINRLQSRLFHRLVGRLGGNRVHDMGCGVRAVRREVFDDVPLYGDFARFLPLLAMDRGYHVVEVPVAQHPLDQATRLYGPGIYLRRIIDVLGLVFLLRFTDKPLRFFGLIGTVLASTGSIILLVLLVQRLQDEAIGKRPLLLLAVLLITLGAQAIALGLIGEIVVHLGATGRRKYRLRHTTDADEG